MKDKYKIALLFFFGFCVITFFRNRDKIGVAYIENLNLTLEGKIIKKISLENYRNHYCIIQLNVLTSNKNYLDDRNKEHYFCVINNKKAEIVGPYYRDWQIGDFIKVNTNKNEILLFRKGELVCKYEINVIDKFNSSDEIINKHEIFKK